LKRKIEEQTQLKLFFAKDNSKEQQNTPGAKEIKRRRYGINVDTMQPTQQKRRTRRTRTEAVSKRAEDSTDQRTVGTGEFAQVKDDRKSHTEEPDKRAVNMVENVACCSTSPKMGEVLARHLIALSCLPVNQYRGRGES